MVFTFLALVLAGLLFLSMLVLMEAGRVVGSRQRARDAEGSHAGVGVVEGSVFGLLGLLMAFTFSGAAARFSERKHLIVEEVNAIGTAWKRIDLLPPDAQPGIRDGFRRYLDARIAAYGKLSDLKAAAEEFTKAELAGKETWAKAAAATRPETVTPARALILPAMNQMFDIAETRRLATWMHPPLIIYVMLAVLALSGALLAGYGMAGGRSRNWIHMVAFSLTIAFAAYVIIDLEYPRLGVIRVDYFDRALVELRATMQ
ncbi:MAG TPA: hypothetical protein VGN76_12380 [Gemmatimonadales bacterium]|nr:hypothetical protein [Gemmatimonadales bacterium]